MHQYALPTLGLHEGHTHTLIGSSVPVRASVTSAYNGIARLNSERKKSHFAKIGTLNVLLFVRSHPTIQYQDVLHPAPSLLQKTPAQNLCHHRFAARVTHRDSEFLA